MRSFLSDNDIPYHSINKNLSKGFKGQSQKVYADVYLDDKSLEYLGTEGYDWDKIYMTILTKFEPFYNRGKVSR